MDMTPGDTRPAKFSAPAGYRSLLICPDDGMMCVGVAMDDGRGSALFAGRRPDGQWPSPQGWLPRSLGGGEGTPGVDDSGWRVGFAGIVPSCVPGTVYARGDTIGTWIGGAAELAVFWLEDATPDRVVNLDPALFIPGLSPAIAPVSQGPNVWRVPAIITKPGEAGQQAGSVSVTGQPGRSQTGIVRNGILVQIGDIDFQLGIEAERGP